MVGLAATRVTKWGCVLFIFLSLCKYGCTISVSTNQGEFLGQLKNYEIVVPSRVTREGQHVSYKLHPQHSLRRRSVDIEEHVQEDRTLHYKVNIDQSDHILQLELNNQLISPGFVIERKKSVYKNLTDSRFSYLNSELERCHYHGFVVNQSESRVALGLCQGLHGFIHTENGDYFIEPLRENLPGQEEGHRHVLYKRSALPAELDPLSGVHTQHRRSAQEDDSCGVKDYMKQYTNRDRWERHRRRKKSAAPHRSKRSFSTERYVETLVVVDPSMVQYHNNEHLETYILTIMNMVAAMFHDASIGNSINIVLVRILLLEEEQEELVITHHADKTLNSFCKFQKNINFKEDDHPNHHDVAILLTRHNICSRLNEPCSTLGLAQVSGMCQPHRSCNINEDTGLALAYTVTHELGHNFGMHHDTSANGCEDPPGKQLFIMSPSLVADSLTKTWSNCSKEAITKFIDRDWGYCLDDLPASHEYKFPVLPPGTMYDADHQCRLQYGSDDASICTNEQDVCSNLWCRSDNKCTTHLEAAAEGTICGANKWCYQGNCVKIGERPEAINGEWGQWTDWTGCTRTCGAGVSYSQRHCNNPQPSHGGKYCLGERKRYRICNTEDCPDDSVTFNQIQCEEFNYVPYRKRLYEWEHVQTSETPCQLHCKPKDHFFSVLLKDITTDGTPCTPGTRNMCISGRCRHVGCDYVIDSNAIEDRCGVCHGDGSTCKTIKSQFNESQGLGYVQAAVIPTGARNIRVEEVAAANNFLALQNDKGEYFLNGHWFIQWSGDYKVAGTVVQYKRHGNKESFNAAGPLKEPLHIMLLLQSDNPGVEFEYTVPKDNISEAREPEFFWVYQHWTHCTASCGGGTQRSKVVCTEIEAGVVEDKYCNVSSKPDDKQKVCNDHLCPARWWVGPWQHCSVTCGDTGQHQRTVICVRSLGKDEQIALDDEACVGEDKPAEVEACRKKEPCPGHSKWITGEWSSCNGDPCGLKYRSVSCENPTIGCGGSSIPASEMQCSPVRCGTWTASEWSECTRTCGEGIQIRKVFCEGGDHCDTKIKPDIQQNCSLRACPVTKPVTSTPAPTTSTVQASTTSSNRSFMVASKPDSITTTTSASNTDSDVKESIESNKDSAEESLDNTEEVTDSDGYIVIEKFDEEEGDEEQNVESIENNNVELTTVETLVENKDSQSRESVDDTQENLDTVGLEKEAGFVNEEQEMETMKEEVTQLPVKESDKHHQENHAKRHKHRHHHGDNVEDAENVDTENGDVQDRDENESTGKTEEDVEDIDIEEYNSESAIVGDIKINSVYQQATAKEEEIGDKSDLKPLAKLPVEGNGKLGKMPNLGDFPPLPNKGEMPVLPDLKDLDPMPDLGDLPKLKDSDLPKLNKFPGFPNNADLVPLPNLEDLLPMPSLKDLPNKELLPPMNMDDKIKTENKNQDLNKYTQISSLSSSSASLDINEIKKESDVKIKDQNLPLVDKNKDVPNEPVNSVDIGPKLSPVSDTVLLNGSPKSKSEKSSIKHVWRTSDWTECSRNCGGGGVRARAVECVDQSNNREVNPDICDINTKPTAVGDCNTQPCLNWVTSSWSECSASCGTSVRTRKVTCPEAGSCDQKDQPTAEEACNVPKCVMWVSGGWSRCTKKCGGGEQVRLVQCVNVTSQLPGLGCKYGDKPDERKDCNTDPCPDTNAAMKINCAQNEMSHIVCKALKKMGQCHKRFVKLKCCVTCRQEEMKVKNRNRPKTRALR